MKIRGQYFVTGAVVAVFVMYLFSNAIIKQEIVKGEDIKQLAQIEEILFYLNNSFSNIDLSSPLSATQIVMVKENFETLAEINNINKYRFEYVYDEDSSKWHITVVLEKEYIRVKKVW